MSQRVAYLINQYPKVSHSFIRREILALERQGLTVDRYALRGWADAVVDTQDKSERDRTRYVLQDGAPGLLKAMWGVVRERPGKFWSALRLATRMGWRADRPMPVHWIYLAEACVLAQAIARSPVSHLHAHFGTNPAEVAMLVSELTGVPYSFTVHGPEEFDRPLFLGLPEKIRRSAFVVAISSYGRSQLYRWVDHNHWSKVQVVHCGLEAGFHESADRTPRDVARLVCVGRLCEQKGQVLLVEAMRQVLDHGHAFELVLAGDGEMREAVEERVRALGLEAHVRITGWIDSAQVRQEILNARALVLPSFAEGLPVVIMEAMALARPVISTYVAGIPELVQHNDSGWLVPAGEVARLADAVVDCLQASPAQLATMGAAARARVLVRHDIDTEAAKLARLMAAPAEA